MTELQTLFLDSLKALNEAREGIEAYEAQIDGYCACDPGNPCYLHGVTIPKAIVAAERIGEELRRKAFPVRQVAE